jgi:MoxR-like ATPase
MNGITLSQCWQDYQDVIDAGVKKVLLIGPPGTGKTFGALNYGTGFAGAKRLICSEDMTSADLEGTWKPNGNNWTFSEGVAVQAWRTGARLVVDEGDKASGDVLGKLLGFLDSVASSSWQNPDTGEVVRPHANFSAVITSNIESNDELPEALADRFPTVIKIDAPHPNALETFPTSLRSVVSAVVQSEPERRVSLRAFYDYQTLVPALGEERSARLVFGAEKAQGILEAIRIGRLGGGSVSL